MKTTRSTIALTLLIFAAIGAIAQTTGLEPEILRYEPFVWRSEIPEDCPFDQSEQMTGIRFLGVKSGYHYGDTWYPTWASNDTLYSPWTDGRTKRLDGYTDWSQSWVDPVHITTGQGVIVGDDPLTMKAYSIGLDKSSPAFPYQGRYPCGSLVYRGVWYYGTYILDPAGPAQYGDQIFNSPWIGAFVGFRYSTDYGHTWTPCPHTPAEPIFGETGSYGYPVKIGSPHFVDFGKNMQHSPDGKAYLVAHGADTTDTKWRFGNDSWITGDQVYLLRVTPSIENINDASKYEFYGGKDENGEPVWTHNFHRIKPLLEWNNNMGCVTITYNAPLKKYIMSVTDGGNTYSKMNTYLLESDNITGEWKLITYMKDFGEQGYFVNIPSKFISKDGTTAWLLYSANYSDSNHGEYFGVNPPGSHYGITFQKIELLTGDPLSGKSGTEKPNLILIVADDLGYGDLGFHGSKQIPTPSIDRLAASGIVFTNGYVSSPVCSPSRAGLLTGKNQVSFGFDNNLFPALPGFDPDYVGLPLTEKTLADHLRGLGYVNGLVGKWHLGEKPHFHPLKRGFDEFWGFLGGAHDYFTAKPGGEDMEGPIECSYKAPGPVTYLTDDIGDECVDFIRRHKNKPFFLFASFNAPHSPMQAKRVDLKRFGHIEDELRRTYCAMVYRLDQNVGKIMKALQEEGIERNSFVVFISDNGGPANSISNGSVNAPLRGQKTTLLEGGIRVPFIARWPAMLNSGQRIDDLVLSLDICPTFIEAAGGAVSEEDKFRGVNIIPFLTGQTTGIPQVSMEWRYTVSNAYREGDWKIIRLPDRLPMLYHLSDDISEQHDVALQNLDRTREMLKKMGVWEIHLPHPVFLEPADWRIRHLGFYDAEYQLIQPEK